MRSEEHDHRKNEEPADNNLEPGRRDTEPVAGLPTFLAKPDNFSAIIGMGRGPRNRVVRGGAVSWIEELGGKIAEDDDKPAESGTTVDLTGRTVSDADLARLASLGSVHGLELGDTPITDAGLAHLRDLPQLRVLCLSETGITDVGLAHLESLLHLEELELQRTCITDAGLTQLTALKNLRVLGLSFTEITDDGLMMLQELKNLESIDVMGTQVTQWAARELKKSLPSLVVRGLLGK